MERIFILKVDYTYMRLMVAGFVLPKCRLNSFLADLKQLSEYGNYALNKKLLGRCVIGWERARYAACC
jgi:hypothetical protein